MEELGAEDAVGEVVVGVGILVVGPKDMMEKRV